MFYPSALHISSIIGIILGVTLGVVLWSTNPFLAVGVGTALAVGGSWIGIKLADSFFKEK